MKLCNCLENECAAAVLDRASFICRKADTVFLIYSFENGLWYLPSHGFTADMREAGEYVLESALQKVALANRSFVTEAIVPVPAAIHRRRR